MFDFYVLPLVVCACVFSCLFLSIFLSWFTSKPNKKTQNEFFCVIRCGWMCVCAPWHYDICTVLLLLCYCHTEIHTQYAHYENVNSVFKWWFEHSVTVGSNELGVWNYYYYCYFVSFFFNMHATPRQWRERHQHQHQQQPQQQPHFVPLFGNSIDMKMNSKKTVVIRKR